MQGKEQQRATWCIAWIHLQTTGFNLVEVEGDLFQDITWFTDSLGRLKKQIPD